MLGRKTIERMTMNHLGSALLPFRMGDNPWPGMGYGLGVAVCMDETRRPSLEPRGTFGWPGAAGTRFWVDPSEELIGIILPQVRYLGVPVSASFQNIVYSAIED